MLFGVRGTPGYPHDENGKRKQLSTLIGGDILPRPGRHSQKPDIAREEIDFFGTGPFLELFARDRHESERGNTWHIWGNELDNDVDLYVPGVQLSLPTAPAYIPPQPKEKEPEPETIFDETSLSYVDAGAIFSPGRMFRHQLWRIWDGKLPVLCFISLNPSKADERSDDPTVRKCKGFASHYGS